MTEKEFDEKFISRLNEQQKEAVRSVDGATLLLAVPGSGKTTVLVTRLGYMVCCKNIAPGSILTMTYTVAATKEMKQRFISMFGNEYASIEFRTINGISSKIIDFYSRNYGKSAPFSLIENDGEVSKIIGQIYLRLNEEYPTESTVKDIRTSITYIKNMMLDDDEIKKIDFGVDKMYEIYMQYCDYLKNRRLMDYDDQMAFALMFLQKCPPVREYFQEKFRYICVDESQDTSKIQHEIIKLLAEKYNNIFMVGDEDQSIYGFRAAYPDALINFKNDYKNAKILFTEKNYRSSGNIIFAANAFISKNTSRFDKKIKSTRDCGSAVHVIHAVDREAQFKYLFTDAQNCRIQTAVLYRNNDSALPLIDMFERQGIPYNCRRFEEAFFSHKIINDITDIINFAYNERDEESFMRIYYKTDAIISKQSALYAVEQSRKTGESILKELSYAPGMSKNAKIGVSNLIISFPEILKLNGEEAVRYIWTNLGYSRYVEQKKLDEGKFSILCMLGKNTESARELLDRISELREIIRNHENRSDNKFILSTIHSSKGLEYDSVYLLDVFDGILPVKCAGEIESKDEIKIYEEERRLYYVAMTRAKNELYFFDCRGTAQSFNSEISAVIPNEVIDSDDIFYIFKQNLLGKIFRSAEKGRGRIIAQCEDNFLIEYGGSDIELLNVEEMANNRNKTVEYEKAKAPKQGRIKYNLPENHSVDKGTRIRHCTFGMGTVVSKSGVIAEVRFDKSNEMKRLGIDTCIKNGLIEVII